MFEDAIKSIKAYLYDKTVSPLMGAFIISWSLWNHRFLMAILFGDGLEGKFAGMDAAIASSGWTGLLLWPFVTSLVYIFIYPYPARLVYGYAKLQQEKLRETKNEIENNRLLTVAESRELRGQFVTLEARYNSDLAERESRISAMKSELETLNKMLDNNQLQQEEVEALRASLATLEEASNKQLNERDAQIVGLEELADKLNKDNQILTAELEEKKASISALENDLSSRIAGLDSSAVDQDGNVLVLSYPEVKEKTLEVLGNMGDGVLKKQIYAAMPDAKRVFIDRALDEFEESKDVSSSAGYYLITKKGRKSVVDGVYAVPDDEVPF